MGCTSSCRRRMPADTPTRSRSKCRSLWRPCLAPLAEDELVGGDSQKFHELRRTDQVAHQLGGFLVSGITRGVFALFRFSKFFLNHSIAHGQIYLPAILQMRTVMNPLP